MTEDDRLLSLALALTDGADVDWARQAEPDDPALEHFRVIEAIARATATDGARVAERRFGPLRVLEKLGAGSSGEVFRAWDTRLEREVALKVLREGAGSDWRLVREARLLARVRHAAVLTVFGVEIFEGRIGLWSELVRGRTLAALVEERGRFEAREAALVGIEVCAGLAALHAAGLVHGDVKAGNVMREDGGRVVLLDFSAARPTSGVEGELSGTPLYLAPEVLAGGAPPSASSDVYAVGVLLYFLASGQHPVKAPTLDGLRRAHARGGRRTLRQARADLPRDFVDVVERALAPPARRYASAAALQAALQKLLEPRRARWSWIAVPAAVVASALALWVAARPTPADLGSLAPTRREASAPLAPAASAAPEIARTDATLAAAAPPVEERVAEPDPPSIPQIISSTPSPSAADEISESDRMREEGEKILEQSLVRMAERADGVAAAWRAYRKACAGKSVRVVVSEGPFVGRPRLVPMGGTAECQGRRADAESLSAGVRASLDQAEEAARRARVLPGRVRDLERRYGLDSPAWQQ
jgi:serine/threonine-protein kinase